MLKTEDGEVIGEFGEGCSFGEEAATSNCRRVVCVRFVLGDRLSHASLKSSCHPILYCREPGNIWSSKVFLQNHIDYVSLNSSPWDGNAPSLGNSWEPRKSKMAAVILINYKMCLSTSC